MSKKTSITLGWISVVLGFLVFIAPYFAGYLFAIGGGVNNILGVILIIQGLFIFSLDKSERRIFFGLIAIGIGILLQWAPYGTGFTHWANYAYGLLLVLHGIWILRVSSSQKKIARKG